MILSGYGDVIINNMTEIDFKPFIHGSYEFTVETDTSDFAAFPAGRQRRTYTDPTADRKRV